MGARDVPPSRFVRAVQEIKTFLRQKPDIIDRVGLVEFSGTSLILSHLTRDVDSLSFYLDWIRESPEIRYGTDIGGALATARELVRKDDKDTTKVFLIISDGADQGTALSKELAAVVNERTRVYTVGIGADPNAIVPVVNPDGIETLLEDDEGQVLMAGFDESTLRDVAVADRRPLRAQHHGRRPVGRAAGPGAPRAPASGHEDDDGIPGHLPRKPGRLRARRRPAPAAAMTRPELARDDTAPPHSPPPRRSTGFARLRTRCRASSSGSRC